MIAITQNIQGSLPFGIGLLLCNGILHFVDPLCRMQMVLDIVDSVQVSAYLQSLLHLKQLGDKGERHIDLVASGQRIFDVLMITPILPPEVKFPAHIRGALVFKTVLPARPPRINSLIYFHGINTGLGGQNQCL